MNYYFRIHGDNIVECERIANLIINASTPKIVNYQLSFPSTISIHFDFQYKKSDYSFTIDLLPGFNKANRKRWRNNIFNALKKNGSFLEETPDSIVTKVENNVETILFSIEFCSALQAGNQAWQRSGRAFSTGLSFCPYIYIVDFVNYELDSYTRQRKSLRFPSPAVPYSYINFSHNIKNFVAQAYIRACEFGIQSDSYLDKFNCDDFAEKDLQSFILKKLLGKNTQDEEKNILNKNVNISLFLAKKSEPDKALTQNQWKQLVQSNMDIVNFSINNVSFPMAKKITKKGAHGKSYDFVNLVKELSVGLVSKDFPIGIIPQKNRRKFADKLGILYKSFDNAILNSIGMENSPLIICILKGFKPKGDDNRPDRGLLPLAQMLTSQKLDIFTYIYGPVFNANFNLLKTDINKITSQNGLWNAVIKLSNYVALDVPLLKGNEKDGELLIDTTSMKKATLSNINYQSTLSQIYFPSVPYEYHEDDVDTGIHFIFAHLLKDFCFEGMCNPPGGDWSGLSIINKKLENRWISLPRVSEQINGKRPDHVIQLFYDNKQTLLVIESKEKSIDLEKDVGINLKNYIKHLMNFKPSVVREYKNEKFHWEIGSKKLDYDSYEVISAAAYIKSKSQLSSEVFENSKCDLLFIMEPTTQGWNIKISTQNQKAEQLKKILEQKINRIKNSNILIF